MPKWITTTWYSINYGWEHPDAKFFGKAKGYFSTPEEELRKSLNNLTDWLDKQQYTIKAVIPKTQGVGNYDSYQNSSWGYGVTPIVGFVVLAQHEREVTVEEYERLSRAQNLKNTLPALREKCGELQQAVDADGQKALDISEKKKLLGGAKYLFAEKEYDSREAAEAALAAMQSEFAARRAELEEARAKIGQMEDELKGLEA